jgi:rhamnogalacturonyl hydrolase YesR
VVSIALACCATGIGAEETSNVPPGTVASAIGVTRRGTSIECWLRPDDFDLGTAKSRLLLVGGLDGDARSVQLVRDAVNWFYRDDAAAPPWRERFVVSAVPAALPDHVAQRAGARADAPGRGFPPPADASYNSPTAPEAAYLWRWIGMHAPDLVIDVRAADEADWWIPENFPTTSPNNLTARLQRKGIPLADNELVVQLNRMAPAETGTVPAIQVATQDNRFLQSLLNMLGSSRFGGPSPARKELQNRLDRTPRQVAEQLSQHYGHALDQVVYIPAMALVARLRIGDRTGNPAHRQDVERIVAPYVSGSKATKPDNGSALSGHLIFCELADRASGDQRRRYIELAKAAADQAFDDQGRPLEAMPYHTEMSDALFMGGPILAHVGALTGESKYWDACLRHLRFMRGLCLRADGLYRHSPLDEAAWGRGNGFPALGVALCLDKFPAAQAGRAELTEWLAAHMKALLPHQDPTGCWHQVVDRPESYRELTATCMIGFAMSQGLRKGWLKGAEYEAAVERAWYAVRVRAPASGWLVDVCTGTGKQKSLRDYYDRPAILGRDDRGGAMSLLLATERMEASSPPR